MQATIPGNKQTPSKTFKDGILYRSLKKPRSRRDDPMIVWFLLKDVDESKNRIIVYDVLRDQKIKISTKQQSFITKYAAPVESGEMHEMIILIFERNRWWVRYDLSKEDIDNINK